MFKHKLCIAKKVTLPVEGKKSYGGIVIDGDKIGYRCGNGVAPYAMDVMQALLADKDVNKLCRDYAKNGLRKSRFAVTCREGMSGCRDYMISLFDCFGGYMHEVSRKKLLHISCFGKLNEGLPQMWVGDYVELMVGELGVSDLTCRKIYRKNSGVKYIREMYFDNDSIQQAIELTYRADIKI